MNKISFATLALVAVSPAYNATKIAAQPKPQQQPNIVLIMCDDMGFSDLACYGGEVRTPNIDFLAENGVRFSQFKNTGRSCPSRAALLTGRYQHEAQMGWMTAVDEHRPGYRGQIPASLPTIAEVLRNTGYSTYMSGKWHVSLDGSFEEGPNGSYPTQRGFDKYYGSLSGGGSYYKPTPVYSNLKHLTEYPDDYYYTKAITDSAVSFIGQHQEDKPMFLYIAHYAPHLPLQAPAERVAACRERYKVGYDVLREERFARQKEMGLVPSDMELPLHNREYEGGKRPSWNELTPKQQEKWINDMATFAAMIEVMDDGIGEVIAKLKEKGMYDNTVFLFLSDNGATSEGGQQLMADLSNTPYRSYKRWVYQGGTSSPLIITYGNKRLNKLKGRFTNEVCHIIDIFPTCLDLAHISPDGVSLLPAVKGGKLQSRDLFFEHQTSCAIISDGWKLVKEEASKPWELINLTTDPFETTDLSAQNPLKTKELENRWTRWAEQQHVYPFENRSWTQRINYYKSLYPDQSGK